MNLPLDGSQVNAMTYDSLDYDREAEPIAGVLHTRPSPFEGLPQCWVNGVQVQPESVRPIRAVQSFAAPGPPPRPGLQWKEETHRWINPHTGEEIEHTTTTQPTVPPTPPPAPVGPQPGEVGSVPTNPSLAPQPQAKSPEAIISAFKQVSRDINMGDTPDKRSAEWMAGLLSGDPAWAKNPDNVDNMDGVPGLKKLFGSQPGITADDVMNSFGVQRKQNQESSTGKPLTDEPDDWRQYVDYHYHDWRANTPPEQMESMHAYQQELYSAINSQLRDGKVDPKEIAAISRETGMPPAEVEQMNQQTIKNMDSLFASVPPMSRPATLWRTVGLNNPGGKSLLDRIQSGQIKPGSVLTDKGYQSTSYVPQTSQRGKENEPRLVFTIHTPEGTKAIPMMATGGLDIEREVVLPRDAQYRVKSLKQEGNAQHVELEYLPEPTTHSAEVFSELSRDNFVT